MNHPPLEPPRFVDDALEQPADCLRAKWPFVRDLAHVLEHFLLAVGLVDIDARRLLEPPDFTHTPCALVQQPHEDFVHPVDVASEFVEADCHSCPYGLMREEPRRRPSASAR